MLGGKNVVVAVSGGIAAFKTCSLVSLLRKNGANVRVMMTNHATQFVTPLTFEALSNNRVVVDSFDRNFKWDDTHISFSRCDLIIIAPATANIIAKYANGICDDFVTSTLTATGAPVLLCPAMNTGMFNSVTVERNLNDLSSRGVVVLNAPSGWLACGDEGSGRMAEPQEIFSEAVKILLPKQDYAGKTVLVTAGGTREPIDPIRFIGNNSSGKMGVELAKAFAERGADVTLVYANPTCKVPKMRNLVKVNTTQEMFDTVTRLAKDCDYVVKAAAPADYKVSKVSDSKIKDANLTLKLEKNPDIAAEIGKDKKCKLIIFCAETENLIENATAKLVKKNADMVVANDVTMEGAGFDVDTNIATIITRFGQIESGKISKTQLAHLILDKALEL